MGAGISGLAAAWFFRKVAGPSARILIMDNHDDFGGHARRNEFRVGGRTLIGYGGTFAIDSPAPYSAVASTLLGELGVDLSRWGSMFERGLYAGLGMGTGIFFDRETFGADRLLRAPSGNAGPADESAPGSAEAWSSFLARAPLSEAARRDIRQLFLASTDHLPGLDDREKKARLARASYADFLVKSAGCHPDVLPFFQARPHSLYGLGIDAVSALDAWGLGLPGFAGMHLDPTAGPGMGLDARPGPRSPFLHFPDGNATIARLLVGRLIPRAVPGRGVDEIVTARGDYARLDDPGPARLRLNSTVVRVRQTGDAPGAAEVEITYARGRRLERVRGRNCVLACWSSMIPYLCPELPEAQRDALGYAIKVPIVYTNVVLRRWTSFQSLGVSRAHCPGSFHTSVELDLPVRVGRYRPPRRPDEPIVVHMMRTPCRPGLPGREQHREGRRELLTTTFDTFERSVRAQLSRMLGAGGFDPARDIVAITVNRWPHGYAYQYNSLWDPFWIDGGTLPCVRARQPFGRIVIANADAAAYAYTDAAIDQAHRAVGELTGAKARS